MLRGFGGGCRRHRYSPLTPAAQPQGSPPALPSALFQIVAVVAVFFAAFSAFTVVLQHGHDVDSATTQQGGTTRGEAATNAWSQLAENASPTTRPSFHEGTLLQEVRLWNGYTASSGLDGGRLLDDAYQRQQQHLDVYNLEYLAEPFRPTVMQVADWHGELPREPKMFR